MFARDHVYQVLLCYLVLFFHTSSARTCRSWKSITSNLSVYFLPCRLSAPRLVCVLSRARDLRTNSIRTDKNSHRFFFLAVACGSACSTMSAVAPVCGLCSFSSRSSLILVALQAASHEDRTINLSFSYTEVHGQWGCQSLLRRKQAAALCTL